MGPCESVG